MLHFLFRHVIWWLLRKLQPVYFTKILWNTLQNNLCSFHSHYFPSVPFSAPCLSYLPFSIILIQTFFFFFVFCMFICDFILLFFHYGISLGNFFRMIFGFQLLLIISLLCFNILIWESYAHMTFLQSCPQFFASSNMPFPLSFFYQVWLPCLICLIQPHCFGHYEKLGILKPRYHKILSVD